MTKRSPLTFKVDLMPHLNTETTLNLENMHTHKRASSKSREGRHFLAAHVSKETTKQMSLLALQQDRTKQEVLIEAINDLFSKYGLSRIADE